MCALLNGLFRPYSFHKDASLKRESFYRKAYAHKATRCIHTTKRQTGQTLSPHLWRQESRVGTCCSRWLISSSLTLLLASSRSSATCGGGRALQNRPPSPKSERRLFIWKGAGHLKWKFVVRLLDLVSCGFWTSLSDWVTLKVKVGQGVSLCEWIISRSMLNISA